jgi:hypothetical protein
MMFKFVNKGNEHGVHAAVFYNGQRICTLYSNAYSDGSIEVIVHDGSDRPMVEWEDYLEDYENAD